MCLFIPHTCSSSHGRGEGWVWWKCRFFFSKNAHTEWSFHLCWMAFRIYRKWQLVKKSFLQSPAPHPLYTPYPLFLWKLIPVAPSHYIVSTPIYIKSILCSSYLSSIKVRSDYMSGTPHGLSLRKERSFRGAKFAQTLPKAYKRKASLQYVFHYSWWEEGCLFF